MLMASQMQMLRAPAPELPITFLPKASMPVQSALPAASSGAMRLHQLQGARPMLMNAPKVPSSWGHAHEPMRALQDEPTAAHAGAARAIGDGPAAPTAQADAGAGLQLASYCACPADVQEQCRRDKLTSSPAGPAALTDEDPEKGDAKPSAASLVAAKVRAARVEVKNDRVDTKKARAETTR